MVYRCAKFRCDWFTNSEDRRGPDAPPPKPKHVKKAQSDQGLNDVLRKRGRLPTIA